MARENHPVYAGKAVERCKGCKGTPNWCKCKTYVLPEGLTLHPADNDPVNRPSHYTSDPSGVECIQITRHRTFNIGNAIKYLWRAGLKDNNSDVQDLKKAIWYIEDEIKRIQEAK